MADEEPALVEEPETPPDAPSADDAAPPPAAAPAPAASPPPPAASPPAAAAPPPAASPPAAAAPPHAASPPPAADAASPRERRPSSADPVAFSRLYPTLVAELSKPGVDAKFAVGTLANLPEYNEILLGFANTVGSRFDSVKREELFGIFLQLVLEGGAEGRSQITPQAAASAIQFIVGYKNPITSWAVLELALAALQVLIRALSPEQVQSIKTIFGPEITKYVPLGYVALALRGGALDLAAILSPASLQNIPAVHSLALFFQNYAFARLSDADRTTVSQFKAKPIADALLKEERSWALGIKLWRSILVFYPRDSTPENDLPLDSLIALLRGPNVAARVAVVELFIGIPGDSKTFSIESQLLSLLSDVVERIVLPANEYTAVALKFASRLTSIGAFPDVVMSFFIDDKGVQGAVVLAAELGLFQSSPALIANAFPPAVKRDRLLSTLRYIPLLAEKGPFPGKLTEALLVHLILIFTTPGLGVPVEATIAAIGPFIKASAGSIDLVGPALLKDITNITDPAVLSALAKAVADAEIPPPERPIEDVFCKAFCHLYLTLDSIADVFHLLRLFVPVASGEAPTNIVDLIARGVPEAFVRKLQSQAESGLEQSPRLVLVAAAAPKVPPKKVNDFVKFVLTTEAGVTADLIAAFLEVLVVQYFTATLQALGRQKLAQSLPKGLLASRKQRQRVLESIRGVLAGLPRLVAGRDLTPAEQDLVWQVIASTVPGDLEPVLEVLLGLRAVFPSLKDAVPTAEQYGVLLRVEFLLSFPVFLANVPPSDDLAAKIVSVWFQDATLRAEVAKDTQAVAELLLRLSPNEQLLSTVISAVQKHRLSQSDVLSLQALAEAAHRAGVHGEDTSYVGFLLRIGHYTLAGTPELRAAALRTIAALFALDAAPRDAGAGLSPAEISRVAAGAFSALVAKASDRFASLLLLALQRKPVLHASEGLLIRVLLAERADLIADDRSKDLFALWARYGDAHPAIQRDIEAGTLALAERAMPTFLPLFVADSTTVHDVIQGHVLRSRKVRPLFLRELHGFLATAAGFGPFRYVKLVVNTEPTSEFNDETFALLVSALFLWIGALYAARANTLLIVRSQQASAIAENFDLIFTRTSLGNKIEAIIDFSSTVELLLTVRYITSRLAHMSIARVTALLELSASVLATVNQGITLVVGLLATQLYAKFAARKSETGAALVQRLAAVILDALQRGDRDTRIGIAAGLSTVPPYEGDELFQLYQATVDGLQADRAEVATRQSATAVLTRIIGAIPVDRIDSLELFRALRKSFDELPFDAAFFNPLDIAAGIGIDINEFITASKLSVEGLFGLVGTDEGAVIGVLKKISRADDVASGLQLVFNPRELASLAGTALRAANQPFSPKLLELLSAIAIAIGNSDDRTVSALKKTLLNVFLPIAEDKANPSAELALGTIRALVR